MTPALELLSIEKSFGPTRALDAARLTVYPGEIHALLGENGAGKSTLVSIAAGRLAPDAGRILRDGRETLLPSARVARQAGIALVPQHDLLIEAATVADNLALLDPAAPFFERQADRRARVDRLSQTLGLDLGAPDALVGDLPIGTRQRIEIAGALVLDPAVLILDEPTAVLAPDEAAALFVSLRRRAGGGRAVVLITHRVPEVFEAADRLTLLTRGRTAFEARTPETSAGEVADLLLGGAEAVRHAAPPASRATARTPGGRGLELAALLPEGSRAAPVSLTIAPGELVTLLAIDGNGADTLAAAAAGLRPASGRVRVGEAELPASRHRAFRAAGGAFVPGDRRGEGLVPRMSVAENLALREARGFRLDHRRLRRDAAERIARYGIRAGSPDAPARELSGGNQQKLLLARELSGSPRVLIAIHPTRGLDLAATADVRERLRAAVGEGCATLVATSDPDEARELGGSIRVVYRGALTEPLSPDAPVAELGRRMAGLGTAPVAGGSAPEMRTPALDAALERAPTARERGEAGAVTDSTAVRPPGALGAASHEPRPPRPRHLSAALQPTGVAAVTLLVTAGLVAIAGASPAAAWHALVDGSVGSPAALGETLTRSTGLVLCALAAVVAFRAGVLNIGAEGQFLAGAAVAAAVAPCLDGLTPGQPVLMLAAAAGGALATLPAHWLAERRGVPAVLSTILLNLLAAAMVTWLVRGPLRDPAGDYPQSRALPRELRLAPLVAGTRATAAVPIALVLASAAAWVLFRTPAGLRLRAVGEAPLAARAAGLPDSALRAAALGASGGLAGLAGGLEILAVTGRLYDPFTSGVGYSGIAAALVGGTHPLGAAAAGLLFAALGAGAGAMQRDAGVPSALASIVPALAVLALLASRGRKGS